MSKTVLLIETSAPPYGVLLAKGDDVRFLSTAHEDLATLKDVPTIVQRGLRESEISIQQLDWIGVNCGPGGTSSIRAGVAMANSLAYSRKIPVVPYNTFELLGFAGEQVHQCPVLSTVKSVRGTAYVGWYEDGQVRAMRYGPMLETVEALVGNCQQFAVAGAHREALMAHYAERTVVDTEQKFGQVETLLAMRQQVSERAVLFPKLPQPITEQSPLFQQKKPK
ncbi:MAG: hypothetical protein AAGJ82_02350 [Bacteroidota bacterium]